MSIEDIPNRLHDRIKKIENSYIRHWLNGVLIILVCVLVLAPIFVFAALWNEAHPEQKLFIIAAALAIIVPPIVSLYVETSP